MRLKRQKQKQKTKTTKKKIRATKRTLKKASDFLLAYLESHMARALDVFRMIDFDKSGTLKKEEFLRGLYNLGLEDITRDDAAALASALDRDGDGKVQYEELQHLLKVNQRAAKPPAPPTQRVGGYGYTSDY